MEDRKLADTLIHRLESGLSRASLHALKNCEAIARRLGLTVYLVGGGVRDLILERDGFDLDLAVEGDVEELALALSEATGGRIVLHDRFGTATVKGRGFAIDLARTRRESYPRPGALPQVEPATLAEDLARRDFTINAVALRLSPEPFAVVDPWRGVEDVRSSLVRVLHERSFQDDATRMLRAVRYATRMDFKIARQTEALIRRDLSFLQHISGPRLRRELTLLFEEARSVEGTLEAQRLGILHAIHPALRVTDVVAARWRDVLAGIRNNQAGLRDIRLDELGFCVLAAPAEEGTAASVSKWLHLTGRIERGLHDLVRLGAVSPKLAGASPSQAVQALEGFAPTAVLALGVIQGGPVMETCIAFLKTLRHVKPDLDGDALLSLGMRQGPLLGETLRKLRIERLEGRIATRDQEIDAVRRLLAEAEGSGKP